MTNGGAVPVEAVVVSAMKVIFVPLALALGGCMGYAPGQQSYWEEKVKEMCEKEGGLTVYERVVIQRDEYQRLGGRGEMIPLPEESSALSAYPYATRTSKTVLRDANPHVYRLETLYLRVADGKVLAKSVRFSRVGGDLPVFDHSSSTSCPAIGDANVSPRNNVFVIEGEQK